MYNIKGQTESEGLVIASNSGRIYHEIHSGGGKLD
jgi:hypothetical protein